MRISIVIIFLFLFIGNLSAQELRCQVTVNSTKITGANKNVFQSMQMDLYEFMNNRKWTKHVYSNEERIECSFNIQLTKQISSDEYQGSITIQSKRPCYNSSYESTILNIKDEYFRFQYQEFQTIEFNETNNQDNLTNVLAYYAYVIIGFDYDTFSPEAGTEYFQKAQEIVNRSQNAVEKGWKAHESDYNRYWLVDNVLNKSYAPFRRAIYSYHRNGLDQMSEQAETGRAEVAEALKGIQRVFRVRSKLYILRIFFDAKSRELVNIFSKSFPDEQDRVVKILSECDPSNANTYEQINESTEETFDF